MQDGLWHPGTVHCRHTVSADALAIIRARVPQPMLRAFMEDIRHGSGARIMRPEEQPAMCNTRVPPHAPVPAAAVERAA
jgi:hypothetical protein